MCRFSKRIIQIVAVGALLTGLVATAMGQELESGFKEPPNSARPQVWWDWVDGNVTKEGITLDLEWMKRVGIGGVQKFDINVDVPQYVDERIVFMTPQWNDALRHAAAECDRLGLEMAMHIAGGVSETGGPWVRPEQSMKKVVWSETRVEGPRKFAGTLPLPPSVNGLFQNLPALPPPPPAPTYYGDSAVIAYRVPDGELREADLHPKITSSGGNIEAAPLGDGDFSKTVALPIPDGGKPAWVQFEFTKPFRTHAFTIAVSGQGIPKGRVQASQDGTNFVTLLTLPGASHNTPPVNTCPPVNTYSFPEATARFYRVEFTAPVRSSCGEFLGVPPPRQYDIAEMEFSSGAHVNRWEDKAGFGSLFEFDSVPTPAVPTADAIPCGSVVDLTSKMGKDGSLNWDVPTGTWVILRMGYSLTGQTNDWAPREGSGYEADMLSSMHMESYLRDYIDPIAKALGPLFGKSFRYFLMDSWEAGLLNWTDNMLNEFRARRGYDPQPYLPVLTGRVVDSAEVSDRFLWDFRRTIADLIADNHYRVIADFLHRRGMKVIAQAMGVALPTIGDGLENKGRVDIPMGEFWTPLPGTPPDPMYTADVRETASAAHIYGKTLAAAESFTAMPNIPGWGQSPFYLKSIGDYYLAAGINRIVFHASAHQPFKDRKPGFTRSVYGQHYSRNITWSEQASAWNSYLSRSSFMLQQGLFVGDLAYFYGEGAPVAVPYWENLKPEPPAGYDYDFLNAEVLLTRMSVKDGRLVLPDGMNYRVLVLPDTLDRMTPSVLRKIRDLVAAGATIIGPKPTKSPSLTGYPSADSEVEAIANEVWGACDGRTVTEHAYGQGKVYWGAPLANVLAVQNTPPDFQYNRPKIDSHLVWIHRRAGDADIYFVANQKERSEDFETNFRVEGKEAELWHPDTGRIEPAEYVIENGRTTVPLHLDPYGSVFVVFRKRASAPSRTLPHPASTVLTTVQGPWEVSFPPNWGVPPSIQLDNLISWTASSETGVKYFSGTATYTKDIEMPQEWFRPDAKLVLDLGRVKEIAEVLVNGQSVGGILWKLPFEVDATGALKPGTNHLEIKITNLWPNRIIGDQQPSVAKQYTFTPAYKPYTKDSPLLESGLLGPVRVVSVVMQ